MKLKKLKITGFKSFIEESVINFPEGISAIVGPNGCGKSNIVDALRWVMGEQSVKQLRGKSMEDVIFAGTKGKPPLNMAEVSLTLENDNGNVPEELKDFTEIMLTRRLYRSGESAYLINKQPCRLKDIHNIFLGSGLGTKAYAVIQQGNIGAITEAGPEERRFYIEEAAGVTRYKNQKNEALRKIESTNQNLLRITDIIVEIKRQMTSLKRQAKKAETFKKYQERIKELEILHALYHYNNYTHQIEETDVLLKSLQDTDIEHISKIKKIDSAIEEIKLQRWQKNQKISEQKSQKFDTQRRIDRVENDLEHLRKDVERFTNEIKELESEGADLEYKNKEIINEIAQVDSQNIRLNEDINNRKLTLDQEHTTLQNIRDRLMKLNQDLETHKTNFLDLVAQEARYNNIYQNASNNKESLKKRLKRADEEEITAKKKIEGNLKKKSKAEEQLESFKKDTVKLDKDIEIIQSELEEKRMALGNHIKLVQTLELDRNKTKSRYTTLKKMEENFDWYKDGVRAIMKAVNSNLKAQSPSNEYQSLKQPNISNKLSTNIVGLMSDVVEPDSSFETAVEAVLGESLQYILVKDQETGLGSIDYLQTHGAGRSGFIPVSSVKHIEYSGQSKPNQAKLLLNHISVKPGFEKIVNALLEHVVVTDDLKEAIKEWNSNGSFQTIVTKEGDIISQQGILIGGSKENLQGILAKKQEIKELKHQITSLDRKLESASHAQKEMEPELRFVESKLQKLIEQKNKTLQNEIEAEKTLFKTIEELKHAHRHLEIVQLEHEQLLGEESDIDDEMEKYNMLLADISQKVQTEEENVNNTKKQISSVSSENEKYNQKIIDIRLKLTALNAKLENNNTTLRRLKEFKDEGIKRREQFARETSRKKQEKTASEQKIIDYNHKISYMYDEMKRLEQELENNETDYQAIDSKLKENDNIISDIQSRREKTLHKIRLLELEQSERRIKQENIANRLEEKYHDSLSKLKSEFNQTLENLKMSADEMEEELFQFRKKIERIGDVNIGAIKEYEESKARFDFLSKQRDDLVKAVDDLHKVITKITRITQERFIATFNLINEKLNEVFPRLFEGGSAKLVLTEPDKPLETGVEFLIHPPGKKLTRMSLLSGGEKALSAIAFIFSIFLIKQASFCLLDEIDAPLDDVNIFRYNDLLNIVREKSQIVMVTHNKKSMEFADTLFGITMENNGISKIVSVNFQQPKD